MIECVIDPQIYVGPDTGYVHHIRDVEETVHLNMGNKGEGQNIQEEYQEHCLNNKKTLRPVTPPAPWIYTCRMEWILILWALTIFSRLVSTCIFQVISAMQIPEKKLELNCKAKFFNATIDNKIESL